MTGKRQFRVQMHRRHRAASGPHRRDEDRRGQDPDGHHARLPQRAHRRGRARRDRQRLSGQASRASGRGQASTASSGMTVGVIVHDLDAAQQRKAAYACDITYGTNNEMGFDYLRDNMVIYQEEHGAARPSLRHRGRGGLHPHRRGAHAADHLRPRATSPPTCTRRRTALSAPCKRERAEQDRWRKTSTKSWRRCARITSSTRKRKPQPHRSGRAQGRALFGVENLSDLDNNELLPPHQRRAARACAHEARRGLRRARTARSSSSTSSPAA